MFTYQAHEVLKDSNGMLHTVSKAPYMMLSCAGQRLFVQAGQVWNGPESDPIPPDQLPGWFIEQMRAQSYSARKEVGYLLPEDQAHEAEQSIEQLLRQFQSLPSELQSKLRGLAEAPRIDEKAPKSLDESSDMAHEEAPLKIDSRTSALRTWTCEACGAEMSTKVKGAHIGRLRRLGVCK